MSNFYSHIYLSPHYDDASLSCGGAIYQQVQAGESVLVITICAAPPLPGMPLSNFAQALHEAWGNPDDIIAVRQAEDHHSLTILGADYVRLNFTDCIYRGASQSDEWYYVSDSDIFGQIHSSERSLSNKMMQAIAQVVPYREETMIYAPLAVGHHVDHQLTRAAVWQLRQQGWVVSFYEDYPYADLEYTPHGMDNAYTLEATLAAWPDANLQPGQHVLSDEALQVKIKSIQVYTSQMHLLFGSATKMEQRVRNYAIHVGEGSPAERIWFPG